MFPRTGRRPRRPVPLGYDAAWGVVRLPQPALPTAESRIFIVAAPLHRRRTGTGRACIDSGVDRGPQAVPAPQLVADPRLPTTREPDRTSRGRDRPCQGSSRSSNRPCRSTVVPYCPTRSSEQRPGVPSSTGSPAARRSSPAPRRTTASRGRRCPLHRRRQPGSPVHPDVAMDSRDTRPGWGPYEERSAAGEHHRAPPPTAADRERRQERRGTTHARVRRVDDGPRPRPRHRGPRPRPNPQLKRHRQRRRPAAGRAHSAPPPSSPANGLIMATVNDLGRHHLRHNGTTHGRLHRLHRDARTARPRERPHRSVAPAVPRRLDRRTSRPPSSPSVSPGLMATCRKMRQGHPPQPR